MKVYVVTAGWWEGDWIVAVYADKAKADECAAKEIADESWQTQGGEHVYVQEHEVE